MADAPLTQAARLIDFAPPEVTEKLFKLQVGGCTCMTKTPELRFHDERCTYRLACEVQDLLNTAAPPSPPVAAPAANEREIRIERVAAMGLDAFDFQPVLYAVQNFDISTGKARDLLRCWVVGTLTMDMLPSCEPWLFGEDEEPREVVGKLRADLAAVLQALRDYHYALDTRQHGGVAQDKAVHAIEEALGMPWKRGEELAARAPKEPPCSG